MSISQNARVIASLLFLLCSGCEAAVGGAKQEDSRDLMSGGDPESHRPTLSLVATSSDARDVTLEVRYGRGDRETGARVAEVIIRHPGLTFKSASPGKALEQAAKELTTISLDERTTRLVMLSSSNINELAAGTLASLRFARQEGRARAEILTEQPSFAPAEANEGLLVSDPIEP